MTNGSIDSGAEALESSIAAVSKYGGATAGHRTMLDALIPAAAVLVEVCSYNTIMTILCCILFICYHFLF